MVPSLARPVGAAVVLTAASVLAAAAVRIENLTDPLGDDGPVLVAAVGLAFVVAAVAGRSGPVMAVLVASVGGTWLVASLLPGSVLVHQALLALALLAFPTGRLHGPGSWLLAAAAVPVAVLLVPQAGTAVLFGAVALLALSRGSPRSAATGYPLAAGTAVAVVLGASWLSSRLGPATHDPAIALVAYEIVLVLVAAAFVPASRAVAAEKNRWTDRLLREAGPAGLGALGGVLAGVLQDPTLRVLGPGDPDVRATEQADDGSQRWEIQEDGRLLAVVLHRAAALDDGPTRAGVESAVRLLAQRVERQQHLDAQLGDLRAARARLVAAADRERASTALDLRARVVGDLERSAEALREAGPALEDPVARDAAAVAGSEVEAAVGDIDRIVAGVPPADLGDGRLVVAARRLAQRSAVPVAVRVSGDVAGGADREAALFYVLSETLANAVKHSGAARIEVLLDGSGSDVVLAVDDDGSGGADPAGSGLQGLVDRLATVGGQLRVDSPRGAGTRVTATVPR